MTAINSPFRYPGGKFYARNLILEHIPEHTAYIEPFAGGGSIFFAKPKVRTNWLNDIDEELLNTYVHIRDQVEALIRFLDGLSASKELHGYYKNEFQPTNSLECAGRWYYLNRTSYSGIMNMQNCYWGYGDKFSMRPENWPRQLRKCSEKLQGVRLSSTDFEQIIQEAPDEAFLFIAPPYFNADQDKFYAYSFTKEDHYRLANMLQQHRNRIKFLITYDDSVEIRDLYSWAKDIYDKQWNYTINRTDDQRKNGSKDKRGTRYKGREIFILNYDSSENEVNQLSLFDL